MTPFFNNIFPSEVVTFISKRPDDFALAAGQTGLTESQKQLLSTQLDFNLDKTANIRQVHGDKIIIVDEEFSPGGQALEEADGLMTKVPQQPLAIRTADCLSVFMYDTRQKCIGLIHAGWKGVQINITGKAVVLMEKQWKSDPKDIKVAFGPSIHPCCNEVGKEFYEYFPGKVILRDGRDYLDLPQIARRQLTDLGVQDENILDCGICTYCDENYFSYRREGESAGRMILLMMLK
jgi:YfiH family protein